MLHAFAVCKKGYRASFRYMPFMCILRYMIISGKKRRPSIPKTFNVVTHAYRGGGAGGGGGGTAAWLGEEPQVLLPQSQNGCQSC